VVTESLVEVAARAILCGRDRRDEQNDGEDCGNGIKAAP
jgi:hypothetical protein